VRIAEESTCTSRWKKLQNENIILCNCIPNTVRAVNRKNYTGVLYRLFQNVVNNHNLNSSTNCDRCYYVLWTRLTAHLLHCLKTISIFELEQNITKQFHEATKKCINKIVLFSTFFVHSKQIGYNTQIG